MTAWWNPSRLSVRWQIVLVLLVTQALAHLLTFGMMSVASSGRVNEVSLALDVAAPMLSTLRTLEATDDTSEEALDRLVALDPRFAVLPVPVTERQQTDGVAQLTAALQAAVPPVWRDGVWLTEPMSGTWTAPGLSAVPIMAALPGDRWLLYTPDGTAPLQLLPRVILFLGITILGVPLALLSVWAGGVLNAPLSRLVKGVEAFAADIDAAPVAPSGPAEVRRTAEAFNRMRARIRKLLGDRSQTLAAISHDMRTPLTRLRLRIDGMSDTAAATDLATDVALLERMIDDALTFLRDEARMVDHAPVDLAVLARTAIDAQADLGHSAVYVGPDHLVWMADAALLGRVIDNLVQNAVQHGGDVRVRLVMDHPDRVTVEVSDTGPGIPPDLRATVTEPFTRLDALKSGVVSTSKGFGLGLAIARDLAARMGGALVLSDNAPRGLRATVTLPRPVNKVRHVSD
jgi:signal transduction histidine kinase